MKLSEIARTKDITFKVPDSEESLNLTVMPDRFTGKTLSELQERIREIDDKDADVAELRFMCSFLAGLIKRWDLLDDNEVPIEISEQSLFDNLPVTLVGMLLNAIQEQLTVSPQKPES